MKEDIEIDFEELITTYNEKGKSEAVMLARKKYNLSFQQVRRRLNRRTDYYFDSAQRQYKHKTEARIESEFMTIEELASSKEDIKAYEGLKPLSGLSFNQSFDDLVKELIICRLMELNKYVSINPQTKHLTINVKNLKRDCFKLIEI